MPRCFVIQPFDKGPFDKRYADVLVPAIEAADLEAYRVDLDPSVSIPIDAIEEGIQNAEVCLADISLDNPNVWFEVGYAIAAGKEVVFICSEDRKEKFPFDVQHRTMTKYATTSPRDFSELGQTITKRLKALLKSNEELGIVSKLSPTQETEGLAPHEVAALIILMEDGLTPDSHTSPYDVQKRMARAGFTGVAVSIALSGLSERGYVEYVTVTDDYGNEYMPCRITEKGRRWVRENQGSLVLRIGKDIEIRDEDIPF
jgi:nucleoside 2-deoxyribosyltransferase